jgi:hypothetical protein
MFQKYRMDGSAYPDTDEGLFEWARDFEDFHGRIVRQDVLWNGVFLSTVWLGLDHRLFGDGPPLIFETMAFDFVGEDVLQERYATLDDAERGHLWWKSEISGWRWTLSLFWKLLCENSRVELD